MADHENNWTLSVPLHHTTKNAKEQKSKAQATKKEKAKKRKTSRHIAKPRRAGEIG